MRWSPDPDALRGRVAVVTGATRGAGRGVALASGEASSGQLARDYGFTDGSRPDIWRYLEAVREPGLPVNLDDYR